MVVGILQFDIIVRGSESLKDKRRVVRSVKDRLHREHLVSVAEVALQDHHRIARMGLALVGSDGRQVGQTFDRILAKLRAWPDAELGDSVREILHDPRGAGGDPQPGAPDDADASDPALAAEMLRRAQEG